MWRCSAITIEQPRSGEGTWVCVCAPWDTTELTWSHTLHRLQITPLGKYLAKAWLYCDFNKGWCAAGTENGQYYACLVGTFGISFSQHLKHSWLSPWLLEIGHTERKFTSSQRRWMEAEASGGGEDVRGGCSFIFTSDSIAPRSN